MFFDDYDNLKRQNIDFLYSTCMEMISYLDNTVKTLTKSADYVL